MNNLFKESDFALFAQYANKTQSEAPEGQVKLRPIYDKLGKVLEVLQEKGYHTNIRRNPLTQAMKYCEYHWGQVYPKDYNHYKSCEGIVFVVIGSTKDGINIHIDSNSRNGFDSDNNKDAKAIKDKTWLEFSPQDASHYSSEDLAQIVDNYFHTHWFEFNLFAKEFGVQESINILNQMKIENIKELLLGNHNLILTGAPGTGKTYLAKQIAKQIIFGEVKEKMTPDEEKQFNEQCEFVQFHPSYDYTDFVEGLRPLDDDNGNVGFERKDGVFKEFCANALDNLENSQKDETILSKEFSVEKQYLWLLSQIENEEISAIPLKTNGKKLLVEKVSDFKNIILKAPNSTSSRTYTVSLKRILKLSKVYTDTKSLNAISNISVEVRAAIGGCNASAYWAVLNFLYSNEQDSSSQTNTSNKKVEKKDFVFIIDEINRGEISKIFGELFFSIDPGYRGKDGKVRTQYASMQEEPNDFDMSLGISEKCGHFFIPKNVYIIGTMNDIDRSVESMDFAFRRRFAFKEVTAEETQTMLYSDDAWKDIKGNILKPDADTIEKIKKRMDRLNNMIWHKANGTEKEEEKCIEGLSSAYHIGASYFLKLSNYRNNNGEYDDGSFDKLWEYHLEGLLFEYLRGTPDIYIKLKKLADAYGYSKADKYV